MMIGQMPNLAHPWLRLWYRLLACTNHDHDATAQELLEILCNAFSALLSRLIQDHLPGGAHCDPSAKLVNETKSVSKTNVASERDFGKLAGSSFA